ncbi:MAG: right-handed parallel beta-helix repeat-containing protein [Anaerolineae bacterium]|nr:right-handed parallel beta-helix repeat-containing protein [Anaerolineae bacterium]
MKHYSFRICLAALLAMGAALLMALPAFADEEPPPEEPAAPPPAFPDYGAAGEPASLGDNGSQTVVSPLVNAVPLALAGGAPGIQGPPWVYYYVGTTLRVFDQPQDAINEIMTSGILPGDRKIYFETGSFNGFTINGTLGVLSQLKGAVGPGTFPNNAGAAILNGAVAVNNTLYGFTLAGVDVHGGVTFDTNSGSLTLKNVDAEGIAVFNHNGSVGFEAVSSHDSWGAYIANVIHASAGVTISNSVFVNNDGGPGLAITTNGVASLAGVVSYNNIDRGMLLTAAKGISLSHASISGNGSDGAVIETGTSANISLLDVRSNGNGGDGLRLETLGNVSLTQVTANLNTGSGVSVIALPAFAGAKNLTVKELTASGNDDKGAEFILSGSASLTGVTTNTNGTSGLEVAAGGEITLNGVTSADNASGGYYGISLNNSGAIGSPGVTVLDSYRSNWVSNNFRGLYIQSKGAVRVNGLLSEGNAMRGVDISALTAAGTVTLNRVDANGNGAGVYVNSGNAITWKGGGASNNTNPGLTDFFGAWLINSGAPSPKAVTLEDVWFFGNGETGQSGYGLKVESNGAISFKTGAASSNAGAGAVLSNYSAASAVPITLSNISFNGNASGGLELNARGAITITNISASWNGSHGADLTSASGAVKVLRTAYGRNEFQGNGATGLMIDAHGVVTLGRLSASDNGSRGISVDNCHQTGSGCAGYWGVTLTGSSGWTSEFSRNGMQGFLINSGGVVSLANFSANDNFGYGGYVWNADRAAAVTLTNGQANDNLFGDGIHVESKGAITVKDIQANGNDAIGINTSPGFTTVEALTPARWDSGDIFIFTRGTDPLTIRLTLEFNGIMTLFRNGAQVDQVSGGPGELALDYSGGSQGDTFHIGIEGSASDQYGGYRLSINDASKTNYSGDGGDGLDLRNAGGSGTVMVKSGPVYNSVETSGNSAFGIYINSSKAVTLTNLTGNVNGGGLFVDNCNLAGAACVSTANVTLNGSGNSFNGNYQDGVRLLSAGAVAITHIDVYDNRQGYGALIDAGSLNITSTSAWLNGFINNHLSGLRAITTGTITVNKVVANGNQGEDGAYLNNSAAATAKAVLVTNSRFNSNATHGLRVNANGSITLRGVSASGNGGGHGAWLYNPSAVNAPVTVQQSTFDDNGDKGAHIETHSNVIWNSSSANGNMSSGGYIVAAPTSTVTLLTGYGENRFSYNNYGFYLSGGKIITINGMCSQGNITGALIDAPAAIAVTIKNSVFEENELYGLYILNGGQSILLNNVQVRDNARYTTALYAGARLVSNGGKITLQNSAFQGNGDFGLLMYLNGGTYTFTNISTLGNNWDYENGEDASDDLDVIINL